MKNKINAKKIIKFVLGFVFLGGVIFLLDFLGICDLSSLLKFSKSEKKVRGGNKNNSDFQM